MMQAVPTLASAATSEARAAADKAKLKSAAQAFEAVFLRQMIGSMREASLGDGMFDNEATEQFQDMADSKTADSMASQGVLHIADMLVKQLGPIAAQSRTTTGGIAAGGTATDSTATQATQAAATTSAATSAATLAAGRHGGSL